MTITTKFQNMNIKAQVKMFDITLEIVKELNKLGIEASILHDEVFIKSKDDNELEVAKKVVCTITGRTPTEPNMQSIYDKKVK